jgi:hypothetical protein
MTNKTASSLNSPLIPTVSASNYGALSAPHDNEALLSPPAQPLPVKNRQAGVAVTDVSPSIASVNGCDSPKPEKNTFAQCLELDGFKAKPGDGLAMKLGRVGFYGTSVAVKLAATAAMGVTAFGVDLCLSGCAPITACNKAAEVTSECAPNLSRLGYFVGAPVGAACYVLGAIGTSCYQGCCQSAPTAKLDAQDLPAPPQQTMA